MQVKVLSVKNPYAYSIIHGGKDVENRTWNTDYRGRLYIHASGEDRPMPALPDNPVEWIKKNKQAEKYQDYFQAIQVYAEKLCTEYSKMGFKNFDDNDLFLKDVYKTPDKWLLKSQSIIGYVDVVDIVKDSPSPWAIEGQYHWILKNPTPLENPIRQVKGRLGLWNYNLPE